MANEAVQGSRALATLIQTRMDELGVTQAELAKSVGRHRAWISNVIRAKRPITNEETIDAFADALDLHPYEIYAAEGHAPHDIVRMLRELDFEELLEARERIRDITPGKETSR